MQQKRREISRVSRRVHLLRRGGRTKIGRGRRGTTHWFPWQRGRAERERVTSANTVKAVQSVKSTMGISNNNNTHVHVYMCTYVHMYMCTYVHMYMCTCVHVYLCRVHTSGLKNT